MQNVSVLVLNSTFFPIHITTLKRAFCMLYTGIAKVVDSEYRTFDFESWAQLSAAVNDDTIGLVGRVIRVPRVIALTAYDRLPKRHVRFSRINILIRDRHTCQYCGQRFSRARLNLDHVIPRSLGGMTTWENIVASCHACNRKKGGQLPDEAGLTLIRRPFRPKTAPFFDGALGPIKYEEWRPFFNVVDFSYWNVELEA
jgi:5-methylcytosine-specific restriction endonuclease McrA